MRSKFDNFIYQFYYLNTNFSGHLEKNDYCPELPSHVSVFTPSARCVYSFTK